MNTHPAIVLWCPDCDTFSTDETPGAFGITCPNCDTDNPPFLFERQFPQLTIAEYNRIEELENSQGFAPATV